MRAKAVETLKHNLQFEKEQAQQQRSSGGGETGFLINQPATSGRREPDTKGYVWVDPQGQYLGDLPQRIDPLTASSAADEPSSATTDRPNSRQETYIRMTPVQRSMHMWRRVNAGCVEATTRWPAPTYKEHYVDKTPQAEPFSMANHMRKTDFSEYVRAAAMAKKGAGGVKA